MVERMRLRCVCRRSVVSFRCILQRFVAQLEFSNPCKVHHPTRPNFCYVIIVAMVIAVHSASKRRPMRISCVAEALSFPTRRSGCAIRT